MITYDLFVDIIFRVLNFGVLIGLGIYIFKKYLKDTLLKEMLNKQRAMDGLQQERDALMLQNKKVSHTVRTEQKKYEALQKKIEQWTDVVEKERAKRSFEKNDRIRVLKKNAQYRVQQIRQEQLVKRVMPRALDEAKTKLQKLFSTKKAQNHFAQQIIQHMQKSES